jgi:hypothetical protein
MHYSCLCYLSRAPIPSVTGLARPVTKTNECWQTERAARGTDDYRPEVMLEQVARRYELAEPVPDKGQGPRHNVLM